MSDLELHWADYLVIVSVLLISAIIGLVHANKARKQSDSDLLLGSRNLPIVPVIFSISVSFVSAVSLLGIPAEIYVNGADYWLVGFGFFWPLIFVAFVVLPIIYRLKLTSAYEYLEMRFSKPVRLAGSCTFVLLMLCYMAVVLYAPALALSQVTDLSTEVSILTVGLICTLYTSFGGIKAVVWTDVFQTLVITVGLCVLIAKGTVEAGGVSMVIDKVLNGTKESTWPMDPDPFVRHTFWTLSIGGGFSMMALYAANQAILQRYLVVDTLAKSKIVLLINVPLSEFYLALTCIAGLVMYAYYQGRDPLVQGRIQKRDQLLPLFVMDIFGQLHGLPGLFIATVFSAALSTVSSGVNALAAVATEDFIRPLYVHFKRRDPEKKIVKVIVMTTAVLFGLLTIGCAYVSGLLSRTLLTIVVSVMGMVGGPLLALMLLGILCPWVNAWGAFFALVASLAINLWTAIGAITRPYPSMNATLAINATTALSGDDEGFGLYDWYGLSYQHYATLAIIVSLVVGTGVSMITCCNKGKSVPPTTFFDTLRPCRSFGGTIASVELKDIKPI